MQNVEILLLTSFYTTSFTVYSLLYSFRCVAAAPLTCAVGHVGTFAVNALALVASQWQQCA